MADTISTKRRSEIMSGIKSKDSAMELSLRKKLSESGFRYRKNVSTIYGKPDIAFISRKIAVFLDSCFWHGCKLHCRMPSSNRSYWLKKIKNNKERDKKVTKILIKDGWTVVRFWEHQVRKNSDKCIGIITELINKKADTSQSKHGKIKLT